MSPKEGGFAAPGRTDNGHNLFLGDLEGNAVQNGHNVTSGLKTHDEGF